MKKMYFKVFQIVMCTAMVLSGIGLGLMFSGNYRPIIPASLNLIAVSIIVIMNVSKIGKEYRKMLDDLPD